MSALVAPIITGTFAKRPDANAAPESTATLPSANGPKYVGGFCGARLARFMPSTTWSGGSARSLSSAFGSSAAMPLAAAKFTPTCSTSANAGLRDAPSPPDSTTAFANRPCASGDVSNALTDMPPADSPMIVTLDASPPNAATLRLTHCSAASWSMKP